MPLSRGNSLITKQLPKVLNRYSPVVLKLHFLETKAADGNSFEQGS
jgi:hypothetical protein